MSTAATDSEKTCDHCHGEGKHTCGECHGRGKETCPECHGEKEVKCSKCKGHGEFSNCSKCGSTGRVDCERCGGSGRIREKCSRCGGSGKIKTTRLRNCGECHGEGVIHQDCWKRHWSADSKHYWDEHYDKPKTCIYCSGTGQKEESYSETCPSCGGSGRKDYTVDCPSCGGRGDFQCSRCHGTGHAECSECSGTGKVTCGECNGKGEVACHDCHGAGDHVCVQCYGTGDKLPDIELKNSGGSEKVAEGVRLVKEKKYIEAFELFREAAVKDHNAEALRRLGARYMNGNAVYQNFKRANLLYRAAANAGDVRSLFILGCNYLEGKGVETKDAANKNRSEARRLLEIATKKGCEDAEPEYLKVATSRLVKNALSGVVGWHGEFELPQFLLDADPAAEQKDKDEKEAARKAEEARKERARKRKIRNIHLCRGLWWFLFRVAAAGAFFTCFKDSYKNVPDETIKLFVAWFFVTSYFTRPRFGGVGYFFIGLAAAIVPLFINSTNPMASFCVFTVMVTFFMRWMGEKLKLPLITYPLVGAMVGFCTSPFAISHNVFNVTPWWFSVMGLTILLFLVNMGMSGNNNNGVVAQGERKTSWAWTFWILGICGLVSWYIFTSATVEQYKFKWQTDEEKQTVKSEERKLSMYEQGVRFRDGDGVSKNMEMAKKMFGAVIASNANEQDVVNAEIALGKILIDEGKADEALKHLKSAAARGNAEAYFLLGEMLQKSGKIESAIKLYQKAADRGFVGAMMALGQYYSEKTGFLGGRRDKNLAVKYYTMAADRGSAEAKEYLKEL